MNEVNDKLLLNNNNNNTTSTTITTTINNNNNNRLDNKLKSSKLLNYILSIICLILITSLLIIIITNLKCINKLKCQSKINNNESSLELNLITYLPTTTNAITTSNTAITTTTTTTININDEQQEQFNSKWNNSRLPKHLKPFHYDINLKIDVYNKSFVGNCTIHFKCLETTSLLVVHSDSNIIFLNKIPDIYEIDSNNFTHRIRKITNVNSVETNLFFNYLIIQLDSNELFKKDVHYTVVFQNYYSEITNNLKGLYYSTYMTKNGILKYI
jgi:hypothetical protein